jgi:NAD(P)-dependent dehydrogenase (short-subunit alcohol dehydrogenase family)
VRRQTTDVAAAVLLLASPAAWFVNGTSVLVDGGWTAQ